MKKVICILLAAALLAALAGCGESAAPAATAALVTQAPATQAPATQAPAPTPTPTPTPEPTPTVELETQSYSHTNFSGYNLTVEVGMYTDWIKATDDDLMQAVWSKAGGSAQLDLYSALASGINRNTFDIAIGYISVTNNTPGFSITAENPLGVSEKVKLDGSKTSVNYYINKFTVSYGNIEFIQMSDRGGKVPFFIIGTDQATPRFPNGNESLDGTLISVEASDSEKATFVLTRPW